MDNQKIEDFKRATKELDLHVLNNPNPTLESVATFQALFNNYSKIYLDLVDNEDFADAQLVSIWLENKKSYIDDGDTGLFLEAVTKYAKVLKPLDSN